MEVLSYANQSVDEVVKALGTSTHGLTSAEAAIRLVRFGKNELPARPVSAWQLIWRQFNTPFIFLLLAATIVSLVVGEYIDAAIVVGFVLVNAALGFTQEWHSARSLQLLKKYIVAEARVRRDRKEMDVPTATLVPGDIIIVEAGDLVPADIRFIEVNDVLIDETILTGESVPVSKQATLLPVVVNHAHEANNQGFSGTTVMSGRGVGVVLATGKRTSLGGIATLTVETYHESIFEKSIAHFSRFILRMILVILVILFITTLAIKGSSVNIFELALFSIALAVGVVPEALPIVITIALSKGAVQMAKNKVVVKRLSAIEDLGSIEVLCTDKTGTITENTLTVHNIFGADAAECVFLAALAASSPEHKKHETNNAFDLALRNRLSAEENHALNDYERIDEIPFDPERRRNSVVVQKGRKTFVIVRGAAEVVLERSVGVSASEKKQIKQWLIEEGKKGNRTIAVATKMTSIKQDFGPADEVGLTLVGLISFIDPVKSTASHALAEAKKLGIAVKIITGDSKEVAGAVAESVGLITTSEAVLTGEELIKMPRAKQHVAVEKYAVFARISPEQKYLIIELLQSKYEVGFLGDGINDAPALKLANVGIVVSTAADIAKDAADIVLLNRSLAVIIQGIKDGRGIFANTVKYIKTTLISNFGNFYTIAIAALLLPYLPMLPVQILLLNLLTDYPMLAIATDTVDEDELRRPKSYNVREIILISVILGTVSSIFDFIILATFFHEPAATLQTNWFISSAITEVFLIFSMRTHFFFARAKGPSLPLLALACTAVLATVALPMSDIGRVLFGFTLPQLGHIGLIFLVAVAYFMVTEIIKVLFYRQAVHEVV